MAQQTKVRQECENNNFNIPQNCPKWDILYIYYIIPLHRKF